VAKSEPTQKLRQRVKALQQSLNNDPDLAAVMDQHGDAIRETLAEIIDVLYDLHQRVVEIEENTAN